MMKRQSGVLMPVFALPGKYGCGTFGESAYKWIDCLSKGGFSCWQVLPFGITDAHNSPYMSCSSFAGNPYFIDPSELLAMGLVTNEEEQEQVVQDRYLCRYDILEEKRFCFLKTAASRIKDKTAIMDFLEKNPRIRDTCTFLALKQANGNLPWNEWKIKTPDPSNLFAWQFIQYEFHRQWGNIHSYAAKKSIRIIGDIPFYVSADSYDMFSSPEQFVLDKQKNPAMVAGVPPDYFCEDGQLWGNPIYNWTQMELDGYRWWKERLGYTLSLFDGVRIDHFRAISSYWSIPKDAETAKEGHWEKGPQKKLIDAFSELSRDKLILAENLGIIDSDTDELLSYSGYPGMAVFQFGFDGNPLSPHLPHNYVENLIAYTGTHDNNTMLGFIMELDEETRKKVLDYLGNPTDAVTGAIRTLMMSAAGTVIFPVQDLLGYGADTRINTPGNPHGNWRYRITDEQLNSIDLEKFAYMNRIYARGAESLT
jgi:4-alpha-glucanotransferase